MSLPIKLLSENAILPTRGTINSAGLDLYLPVDVTVPPQSKVSVPLDIAMAIPEGYYGKITIRSGACKREDLMEGAGVIDSDYRGNIEAIIYNFSNEERQLKKGNRYVQMILHKYAPFEPVAVEDLNVTERTGGFGSTGLDSLLGKRKAEDDAEDPTAHQPELEQQQ